MKKEGGKEKRKFEVERRSEDKEEKLEAGEVG